MKRLLIYSHDTYGLGNIRRILSVVTHLSDTIPNLSTLIVSGSPMVHSFRIPRRVDYIKLPCLRRSARDGYCVKYLGLAFQDVLQLRSDLIQSAISHFKPDLMLVDKKPFGVEHELEASLHYLRTNSPNTKLVLLLRDILDSAEPTRRAWERNGYHEAIRSFYDLVLVLGLPEVFDPRSEYHFPRSIAEKIRFCGYVRREAGRRSRDAVRASLHIKEGEKLVLVTPGGGRGWLSPPEYLPRSFELLGSKDEAAKPSCLRPRDVGAAEDCTSAISC